MNTQYLIIFLLLFIKGNDGKDCNKLDTSVRHCPSGNDSYYQNIVGNCLLRREPKATWEAAKAYCEKTLNPPGSLASAVAYKQQEQVKSILDIAKSKGLSHWIGATDTVYEATYVFTNGYKMLVSLWKKGEPTGNEQENCIIASGSGKLEDTNCSAKHSFFCQTESNIGPRELQIKTHWHDAGKKVFYKGFNASVTCSVFGPLGGQINWRAEASTRVDLNTINEIITVKHNLEINELGKCQQRTYSTFQITADQHTSWHPVCYPRPTIGTEICPKNGTRLAYCKQGEKIRVSSAVKTSPNIYFRDHPGMPGPAVFNTIITMRCSVLTDGTEQSIFLINYATGPVKPKASYLSRNVKGTQYVKIDTLTLNLPFKEKHANATFSCFVNDVVASGMDTTCRSDNPFCAELPVIISTATPGAKKGPRSTHLEIQSGVYFVQPNYFYEDEVLFASCSALDAYQGKLKWKAFDRTKTEVNFDVLSSNSSQTTVNGEIKTKSQLSISVTSKINNTQFSCYSDAFPHRAPCEYKGPKYKFCDAADMVIIVVKKPDPPILDIYYPGYPSSAARHGSTLTANCIISSPSPLFTLKWIIYDFGQNVTRIVDTQSSIVESYNKSSNTKEPVTHYIKSTLKIPVRISMDGMSIACLAYDIKFDNIYDLCTSSDDLCNKSTSVEVLPALPKEMSYDKIITVTIVILVLILVVLLTLHMLNNIATTFGEDEKHEKEANDIVSINENDVLYDHPQSVVSFGTGVDSDIRSKVESHAGKSTQRGDNISMAPSTKQPYLTTTLTVKSRSGTTIHSVLTDPKTGSEV